MVNFWRIVNKVIESSDVILMVLDSRMPELTRNYEIERKVRRKEKSLIFVLNKCDLISQQQSERIKRKLENSVFVSSINHHGSKILREKILSKSSGDIIVGVLGYPNVGKSSVINMLKGKTSARVAPISGYTRGMQKVRISGRMLMYDTPGVIPYMERDELKQVMIGTLDFDKIKDPESLVLDLISNLDGVIQEHYGIDIDDEEEVLEKIALLYGKLRKKAKPDTYAASRLVLKDWQRGKIRIKRPIPGFGLE